MEQSPSLEANSNSASQEIPSLLWNPKVHYHVHKISPLVEVKSKQYTVKSHLFQNFAVDTEWSISSSGHFNPGGTESVSIWYGAVCAQELKNPCSCREQSPRLRESISPYSEQFLRKSSSNCISCSVGFILVEYKQKLNSPNNI
jgi:hypothetical protein